MRRKFLIYVSQPYGVPVGKPLEKEIVTRGLSVAWFCVREGNRRYLDKGVLLLQNVEEVIRYNADVVLVTSNTVPDFFPGIKVQVFHGFSVSKRSELKGHFRIRGLFDLYCTQGPSTTVPFQSLQRKHQHFEVAETGWSKMDPLFPIKNNANQAKPTIIISSTFTTKLSLAKNEEVFKEIRRLSKLGNWNFISILHPKMEQEIVEKFRSLDAQHFKFFDTIDLVPLFREANIMFADTTSAITEFILQRKPVVTFNNNKPASYMLNISSANEIESAITHALSRPETLLSSIDKYIEKVHPYKDGASSARVIDASLSFLKNSQIKRKPLNLVRRLKVRKDMKYYKLF